MYYQLYADDSEMPSKVANDPEKPSIGRIRADSITPPHSPTTIKLCISRVERNPGIVNSDLFADPSFDSPLTEGYISILSTDGPGMSPNEPMAIVQADVQEDSPLPVAVASIPDGRYAIKNRAEGNYWNAGHRPIHTVYFYRPTMEDAKKYLHHQVNEHSQLFCCSEDNSLSKWDITHDTDGNITMTSPYAPSSWVGVELKGSSVPVPWRLIPADSKSF